MNPVEQLRRHKKLIVADLNVADVLPILLSKLVIDHRDKQIIDNAFCREDKAELLIDIVADKARSGEPEAVPLFISALQEKYEWIWQNLTEDVTDSVGFGNGNGCGDGIKIKDEVKGSRSSLELRREGRSRASASPLNRLLVYTGRRSLSPRPRIEVGGVQNLPPFVVERKELLGQIRSTLEDLKPGHFLVLQGMAGSGKSVLATQAVSEIDFVHELFPSGVFWLQIGKECSESKDAILSKMRILCDKLGESRAPTSLDHGADLLRTAFDRHQNSLLVLDDVWRSEVIRAFDFCSHTLVTTRDLSIMSPISPARFSLINISEGLKEEESYSVFSLALKTEPTSLPPEARQIHQECRGSPMVISLIASLLSEHQFSDPGRWAYYLQALSKRCKSPCSGSFSSIQDAMSLSIEDLPEEKKDLYLDFALFPAGVGLPSTVFITLWKKQRYEVEDIMKFFARKSLVIEEHDSNKSVYIYSVHDLLLDYLKSQLTPEEEQSRHAKLVYQYLDTCAGDWHRLPDDGYIYFYLCYHLYKAKLTEQFEKAYLSLLFLGEKLRVTGPADLLVDVRKYNDFIVGGDPKKAKIIEEIQTFAQLVGPRLYGQLDVDVIQIALQTPHLQWIHNQAKNLAKFSSNRLYLEWKNAGQWKLPESAVLCGDHVTCVKFLSFGTGNLFVCGLFSGCIQIGDLESSSVCHIFFGHTDSINSLSLNPLKSSQTDPAHQIRLLSSSSDKTCKIWDLTLFIEALESQSIHTSSGTRSSPSPKLQQDQWTFNSSSEDSSLLTFSHHYGPVLYAEFSIDGSLVLSTSTNEIMLWNTLQGVIVSKYCPALEIFPELTFHKTVSPPEPFPKYFICLEENQVILLSSERPSIYSAVEAHSMRIVDVLFLSMDTFCTVSESEIGLWKVRKLLCSGSSSKKAKAFRSRSLSPSRCLQFFKTSVDSKVTPTRFNTLDPKDISDEWNATDGRGSSTQNGNHVVKSSSATLNATISVDQNGVPASPPSAAIDVGEISIEIVRERVYPNIGRGILLCAAATQSKESSRVMVLACGTSEHKIVLWKIDLDSLNESYLGSFTSHTGWVTSLDFSCIDSCTVLSGSEDRTVMVWDIEEEEKGTKDPQKNVHFASTFVPANGAVDKGSFYTGFYTEKNTVQIFKDTKQLYESPRLISKVTAITVSACGNYVGVGTVGGQIFKINLEDAIQVKENTNVKLLGSMDSAVSYLAFGGKFLVAGSSTGSLMIFDKSSALHSILVCSSPCVKIHFSEESNFIAVFQDSYTIVMDASRAKDLRSWKDTNSVHVTCSSLSFDYSTLILGYSNSDVVLLSVAENLQETRIKTGSNSPVRSLAVNNSLTKLAIGFDNGIISIWTVGTDALKQEMELVLHKSWVRHLHFSSPSMGPLQWLISCGDKLAVWSLDKFDNKIHRPSFMNERRRRRSGESPARNPNRLSLEIPSGNKIGRQGKRELLQQFTFRGNYAQQFVTDPTFSKILTVDDTGIFYMLETLKVSDTAQLL